MTEIGAGRDTLATVDTTVADWAGDDIKVSVTVDLTSARGTVGAIDFTDL